MRKPETHLTHCSLPTIIVFAAFRKQMSHRCEGQVLVTHGNMRLLPPEVMVMTARDLTCNLCNGEGKLECNTCEGKGYVGICSLCEGSARKYCRRCEGSGMITNRMGLWVTCPNCHGNPDRGPCPKCNAISFGVIHPGFYACRRCNGYGHVPCRKCGGSGRFQPKGQR